MRTYMQIYSEVASGKSNLPPAQAWASVARSCVHAKNKVRNSIAKYGTATRMELNQLDNIDRTHWLALARLNLLAEVS